MSTQEVHTYPERRKVAILGQGYVGLPLAFEATRSGWEVIGFDTNAEVVRALAGSRSLVDDVNDEAIGLMLAKGYTPTSDEAPLDAADIYVICVPTPMGDGGPDLRMVESAAGIVAANMSPGCLVILESTTYPGTTEELLRPLLEHESGLTCGDDFLLAFSPERVNPGFPEFGIQNTPKLVGGVDERSTRAAIAFYSTFVDEVVQMKGSKEAEMAKLLENTFRHVNIALVNEMAKFCHELGVDIWNVIEGASTKPFGFMRFNPGPGVGGHCIPIDPNYLSYEVRRKLGYPFRFVELAQEINNSMPSYVVSRIADLLNERGKALRGSQILLLGVTYKANIADQRESPALPIALLLQDKGAIVTFHDPAVAQWMLPSGPIERVGDLSDACQEAELVCLLQAHRGYDVDALVDASQAFFDTRGIATGSIANRL
ncbi:nucleotide sugar dehydrogenase [Tessaracoccus sp. Y1736]